MHRTWIGLVLVALVAWLTATPSVGQSSGEVGDQAKVRTFRLDYEGELKGLPKGARARVWFPVPSSDEHQSVTEVGPSVPTHATSAIEPTYGNRIRYFEAEQDDSSKITFKSSHVVERREVRSLTRMGDKMPLDDAQRRLFLAANTKIPLQGKQLDLLNNIAFPNEPLSIARALYDRVDEHVRYDKSLPGFGQGDVLWVCDSRVGNCTDFHSLFISWSRAKGVPAQFEIGFPLPRERGQGSIPGYHCWALFHTDEQGWVPVDISEADKHPELKQYYFGNLTEDRVTFARGRDINLVPRQNGPPLNFFVYPYVEVNGAPLSVEQVKLSVSFTDIRM